MEQEKRPDAPRISEEADLYYNTVFEQLVDQADTEDKQLIGLVAYGLYKVAKREWLLSFKSETGRKPTDSEHKQYAKSQTGTILDGYRSQATELVATYANAVLESERPKVLHQALQGSFWRSFWPSFWSSVAFAALLVVLGLILAYNGVALPIEFKLGMETPEAQGFPKELS